MENLKKGVGTVNNLLDYHLALYYDSTHYCGYGFKEATIKRIKEIEDNEED